ncbi:hypothetical protein BX600DRAFT_24229 [Xylariales sp. PMI_506]|nr:hypothetical protein BX600DRAFT_24229 [Xylariales sp. PMI_506]
MLSSACCSPTPPQSRREFSLSSISNLILGQARLPWLRSTSMTDSVQLNISTTLDQEIAAADARATPPYPRLSSLSSSSSSSLSSSSSSSASLCSAEMLDKPLDSTQLAFGRNTATCRFDRDMCNKGMIDAAGKKPTPSTAKSPTLVFTQKMKRLRFNKWVKRVCQKTRVTFQKRRTKAKRVVQP